MQLPHPPAALSERPFSARLPGQSLLCCPGTGAHDLQRGTRARVPLETTEVSNPPTAKGARWALRDAASMGKYGGRREARQRQGKHNKEQMRSHSVSQTRRVTRHSSHPIVPCSICLPRLWQGHPPTSHRESARLYDLYFAFLCSV